MTEAVIDREYSVGDVARIFGLQEARLRYWAQTGFVGPSVRRRGRFFYTFQDLIGVRTAKELLDKGLTLQRVRRNLDALRGMLPTLDHPLGKLKVCCDGDNVVVVDQDVAYEPASGQVVMDFTVDALRTHLADVHPIGASDAASRREGRDSDVAPKQTAYQWFLSGCAAEDRGQTDAARDAYARALAKDPGLAAAYTNLGNLYYRTGEWVAARSSYERALDIDSEQPEARFNLGNVLDDMGDTELAIAELRRVCNRCPEFADAHFNLGEMLARTGGLGEARTRLEHYLRIDPGSEWADKARALLLELSPNVQ